jgi:sugar lactone lactonase YvrE
MLVTIHRNGCRTHRVKPQIHMKKPFTKTATIAFTCAMLAIAAGATAQLILSNGMPAGGVIGQPDLNHPVKQVGVPLTDIEAFEVLQPSSDQTVTAPNDADFDPETGILYIVESWGQRVLAKDVRNGSTNAPTLFVLGQGTYTSVERNFQNPAVGCVNSTDPNVPWPGPANACNLYSPTSVVVIKLGTAKYLAVSDYWQHRVLFFNIGDTNTNGETSVFVLGQSDFTTTEPNRFCSGSATSGINACSLAPFGLAFEANSKTLIVSDAEGNRVMFFDLSSGISNNMAAVKVLGQQSLVSEGGVDAPCSGPVGTHTPNACGINFPGKPAWDPTEGALYVPTQNGVRAWRYSAGANLSSVVANGAPSTWVIGQPNYDALPVTYGGGPYLNSPAAAAVDNAGRRLFVADFYNCRVVSYDISGDAQTKTQNGLPPSNVLGYPSLTGGAVDPGSDPVHQILGCGHVSQNTQDGTFTWLDQPASAASMLFPNSVTWDATYGRLFVVDNALNRVLSYGSLVQGIPIQTSGGNSTTTPNPDGSTTATISTPGGSNFGVTFPPGTGPVGGSQVITVTASDGNGGSTKPAIAINATLPPGVTKSVTIPYANRDFCINDVPGATIDSQGACPNTAVKVKKADLPAPGACIVWRTPDTMCRSTGAGTSLIVNGLKNTALFYISDSDLDGVSDDVDLCPGTNLSGPVPTQSLKPNSVGDSVLQKGGCNCSQILACKRGSDTGEIKFGCSAGTINVWDKGIGWAKACQ